MTFALEEEAIALLLRSPRLEVSQIMRLLDVSDAEFRAMIKRNARIAALIDARRTGTLEAPQAEPVQCPACDEWFLPYGAARFCSDPCRNLGRLAAGGRRRAR